LNGNIVISVVKSCRDIDHRSLILQKEVSENIWCA